MNDTLCRNLNIISKENRGSPERRYVAKPLVNGKGKRWGVYDQRSHRWLGNRELSALSEREIREAM